MSTKVRVNSFVKNTIFEQIRHSHTRTSLRWLSTDHSGRYRRSSEGHIEFKLHMSYGFHLIHFR